MIITYLGHSCFKLRGSKATVVTDPYDKETFGRLMPATKADIVTISHFHHDHAALDRIKGAPFVIQGPGEYEIKGVSIWGIPSFHDKSQGLKRGRNTIYVYHFDKLKLCHLGDLGTKLSDEQIEEIGEVDILMVPVGGIYTIDAKQAVVVINQLEPMIVIPMHYQTKDLKFQLDSLDKFWQEIGEKEVKPVKTLKINSETLPKERKVVWLKK